MEYLITPPEQTDYKIHASTFMTRLLQCFPDAQVQRIDRATSMYCCKWSINVGGAGLVLEGALHRYGQGVSLDGYLEDCTKFALWVRSQVPLSQPLVFYDQGYNDYILLEEDTTMADILNAFTSGQMRLTSERQVYLQQDFADEMVFYPSLLRSKDAHSLEPALATR